MDGIKWLSVEGKCPKSVVKAGSEDDSDAAIDLPKA